MNIAAIESKPGPASSRLDYELRPEFDGQPSEARQGALIRELLAAEQNYYAASVQLAKIRAAQGGALNDPKRAREALPAIHQEYSALRRHSRAWEAFRRFRAMGRAAARERR